MSSFCQGIICIIWITWNSCRSVLHPVAILPPLLSLSLYKMDALIWDSHPHNNNNSCVCGVCMELLFLHDGFEIRNLVIQSMMSLSLCFSLGYLQTSFALRQLTASTAILKLAETQGHRCRHHHLMCANGLQVYIYVPMLHIYPLPFSSDSRSKKTNHEITRSYGEQILVAIWTVNNRVTLTDWWCWCLFCGWMLYSRASEMHPLMKIDNNGQVTHFNEKPWHESLSSMVCLKICTFQVSL
jgi:hypothetical protein